ncbi:MAG: phosphoenolpyruvate carboxylase [Gammaproteobacteria bacterium]|nr:phosphoenolpyruvate carboxylase [Gammaproteobacteria bacterium]
MGELVSTQLWHRVRLLGNLLGQTMVQQHGEEFLNKEEEIRLLAKSRRQNENVDPQKLQQVLAQLDDDYLISIARAFNQFLNLYNIAEQAEAGEIEDMRFPETSNLADLFAKLQSKGIEKSKIAETIKKMRCDLVLTAHPTEITRRTLIQKYGRIARVLSNVNENEPLRQSEQTELERLIAEVWYTDEIPTERPTPREEAIWGYAWIEHSFWTAIPKLWEGLDSLLQQHTGQSMTLDIAPVKVSSWMGGDRDGNPNVTAEVTADVLRLARWMAADLYLRDIEELRAQLSMSQCTEDFRLRYAEASDEPYKVVLRDLRAKLTATRLWAEGSDPPNENLILYRDDLYAPLHACYESLKSCGMGIIADGLLKQTLIRVSTFGVTLVDLDIRQNADRHIDLLDELTRFLEIGSYREWSEKARNDFLLQELNTKRPLIPEGWEPQGNASEVLKTFRLIAEGNAEGISSYIISMAKNPSDVLAVVLLLQKCGLERKLPVVPLFETLEDLENAAWTLERLLRTEWYTNYVEGYQQVMIGYSDSAKDAGQMAAAWAQYGAQEELVLVANKYHVDLTLFHGRGGAAGRGGTPPRQAVLSQPPGSVNSSTRVTEQGEMIRFKYGSAPLALNNLDLILSATIEASLLPPPEPMENWRSLMDRLSDIACRSYRKTVQDPNFVEYFVEGTPERELALLALGSRPARRSDDPNNRRSNAGATSFLNDLRAIPWVFAWTQKRLMIPAWLGTDAAFSSDLSGKEWFVIKEMIREWPFFQSQLDMLEMVLAKADIEISERYDNVLVSPDLKAMGDKFREQLTKLTASVNKIKGQDELLEKLPEIKRTLELRHPYTDPLHFLQIELISRHRHGDGEHNENVKKALLVTIAGIAAGMRSTG